jgi:hypothetical protein
LRIIFTTSSQKDLNARQKMNNEAANIDSSSELPPHMKVWKEKFGKAVLVCSRCKNLATGGYESIEAGYTEMECVVFSCHNHGCGNQNWA